MGEDRYEEKKKSLLDPNTKIWCIFLCFPVRVTYLSHSHALNKAEALLMLNKVPAFRHHAKGKDLALGVGNFSFTQSASKA